MMDVCVDSFWLLYLSVLLKLINRLEVGGGAWGHPVFFCETSTRPAPLRPIRQESSWSCTQTHPHHVADNQCHRSH